MHLLLLVALIDERAWKTCISVCLRRLPPSLTSLWLSLDRDPSAAAPAAAATEPGGQPGHPQGFAHQFWPPGPGRLPHPWPPAAAPVPLAGFGGWAPAALAALQPVLARPPASSQIAAQLYLLAQPPAASC